MLSIALRGPIFTVAGWRQGWKSGLAALLTESVFCALSAGFYGALVQLFKDTEPEWLTGVFLAGVVPIFFQVAEYYLHRFRGTPHLFTAALISLLVSGISALFNWYAMRRGTLLVGGDSGSFGRDLRSLPGLMLGFMVVLPAQIAAWIKSNSSWLLSGIWGTFFLGK